MPDPTHTPQAYRISFGEDPRDASMTNNRIHDSIHDSVADSIDTVKVINHDAHLS